ncbi:MAG: hypothetical protein WA417_08075 [Stellaceae bacterium]
MWRHLQPLAIDKMPLDVPPPRSTRFFDLRAQFAVLLCRPARGYMTRLRFILPGRF